MGRVWFWLLVAATLGIYLTMVIWSLPLIAQEAGGQQAFDLRPMGYTFDEAKAFLTALTPHGRSFYFDVQHRLDLLFPGLMAATLYFAIATLLPQRLGRWRYVIALPVLALAVFDWSENRAVAALLRAGPEGLTPEMVASASRWSVLKAISSTIAYSMLIVLLVWKGISWMRQRRGLA